MAKKKKVVRKRQRQVSLVSGIIYTFAVIGSIALGAFIYRQYQEAQQAGSPSATRQQAGYSSALPPGSKVVTSSGETIDIPHERQPGKAPEPEAAAIPSPFDEIDTVEQQAEREKVRVQPPRSGPPPTLEDVVRVPWDVAAQILQGPQKALLYPAADTTIYAKPEAMQTANDGLSSELIAKGDESFILTQYDLREVDDWTIKKATWRGKLKRGRAAPLTFSTIRAYWTEGGARAGDPAKSGATYAWADYQNYRWRADEATAPYVFNGHSHGLQETIYPENADAQPGDWITYELDPRLVQSLIAGDAFGLAITEEKGQSGIPCVIGSREEDEANYYIDILGSAEDVEPPGEIGDFWIDRHPQLAMHDRVGVVMTWTATGDDGDKGQAFRYDIRYAANSDDFDTATRVPVYEIPRPVPAGQADKFVIQGLLPDTLYTFFLRAVDEVGNKGEVVRTAFRTGRALTLPRLAPPKRYDQAPMTMAGGRVSLEVVDAQTCIDPTTGKALANEDTQSPIWNSKSKTVRITAAQNETVTFQIVVGRKTKDFPKLKIHAGAFEGPKYKPMAATMTVHRVWYSAIKKNEQITWHPDALIPHGDYISVPMPDNKVGRQVVQSLVAQLHIPRHTEPGTYTGELTIEADAAGRETLNVFIDVADVSLPATPEFTVELADQPIMAPLYAKNINQYAAAVPIEQKYHKLANNYRCTLAMIPQTDDGRTLPAFAPPLSGTGKDVKLGPWEDWTRRYGPILDGDLFFDPQRGAVSASHFILPLSENWPMVLGDAYQCAGQEVTHPDTGHVVFDGTTQQIPRCLSHVYWDAWRATLESFGNYVEARGWHDVQAHVWLHTEPAADYVGKAPPWNLFGPRYRDDFVAIEQFGTHIQEAAPSWPVEQLVFRVNVPNIASLRDRCEGRLDLLSVQDRDLAGWKALRERARDHGETLWLQSTSLPLDSHLLGIQEEGIRYFLRGATGWSIRDVLGRKEDWVLAHDRSLLYVGLPQDLEEPLPSLRLNALRHVQQDIELLSLLQKKKRWSLSQLQDFVGRYVPHLESDQPTAYHQWYAMRSAILELLAR